MMKIPPANRSGRVWRRFVGGLCAAGVLLQAGCYSYLPVQTALPATGTRMAVVINDRGRVAIGDRVGSAVELVEGLLVATDSSAVTIEVYRTTDMRGRDASWTGESVRIPKDAISGYRERVLSKRKTAVLVGGLIGAIVVSAWATNFDLFSGFTKADPETPPTGESR
jgi:hypothetical protein